MASATLTTAKMSTATSAALEFSHRSALAERDHQRQACSPRPTTANMIKKEAYLDTISANHSMPVGFALMSYRHLVLAIKRPFGAADSPPDAGSRP